MNDKGEEREKMGRDWPGLDICKLAIRTACLSSRTPADLKNVLFTLSFDTCPGNNLNLSLNSLTLWGLSFSSERNCKCYLRISF